MFENYIITVPNKTSHFCSYIDLILCFDYKTNQLISWTSWTTLLLLLFIRICYNCVLLDNVVWFGATMMTDPKKNHPNNFHHACIHPHSALYLCGQCLLSLYIYTYIVSICVCACDFFAVVRFASSLACSLRQSQINRFHIYIYVWYL